jgi:hypothetical protein
MQMCLHLSLSAHCTPSYCFSINTVLLQIRINTYKYVSVKNAVSGMMRRVALVRTDFSEKCSASINKVIFDELVFPRNVLRLLVIANVVPSSPTLVILMMEALRSSEMSVLKRATRPHILEDGILHSHRREKLKSYIVLTGWTV